MLGLWFTGADAGQARILGRSRISVYTYRGNLCASLEYSNILSAELTIPVTAGAYRDVHTQNERERLYTATAHCIYIFKVYTWSPKAKSFIFSKCFILVIQKYSLWVLVNPFYKKWNTVVRVQYVKPTHRQLVPFVNTHNYNSPPHTTAISLRTGSRTRKKSDVHTLNCVFADMR